MIRLLLLPAVLAMGVLPGALSRMHDAMDDASDGDTASFRSPLAGKGALVLPDTLVARGERTATVRIRLKEPLRRPVRFRYRTRNGSARQDIDYRAAVGNVLFLPGETEKQVSVPILRDLGDTRFSLVVGWPQFHPYFDGGEAVVREGVPASPIAPPPQPSYPTARMRSGRHQVFASNFLEPVRSRNAPGQWRSGFSWGRVQTGNRELAPYADQRLDGTDPHPIVAGKRVLQAEHRPISVRGKRYAYSTAMMATRGMTPGWRYGYFEARVRIPRAQGTTPAFWLLPDHDAAWPPEMDIFEIFQKTSVGDHPDFTSSIHWKNPVSGRNRQEGVVLAFDDPFAWHVIGFDWTPQWMVTLIDGKEVLRRPNLFDRPMYAIFSMAVGGLTDAPRRDSVFPARMTLDYFTVWQGRGEDRGPPVNSRNNR